MDPRIRAWDQMLRDAATFNDGPRARLSATRWLAWENAVARVPQQFQVLKQLFRTEAPTCHSAQNLSKLYHCTISLKGIVQRKGPVALPSSGRK